MIIFQNHIFKQVILKNKNNEEDLNDYNELFINFFNVDENATSRKEQLK